MQSVPLNIEEHLYGDLNANLFIHQLQVIGQGCHVGAKKYAIKMFRTSSENVKTIEIIKTAIRSLEQIRNIDTKPSSIPVFHGHFLLKVPFCNDLCFFLVFDHFPKSLRDVIKEHKEKLTFLPFNTLIAYFTQVLFGMAFLQSIDIAHRNLNPGNLMLDEAGALKIIDFGLAKDIITMKNQENNNLTTKVNLENEGTVGYMAPEIEGENPKYNPYKSDVFSFGLIILELATMLKPKANVEEEEKFTEQINDLLNKMKEKIYNDQDQKILEQLCKTLKECLYYEVKDRPDFLGIFRVEKQTKISPAEENKINNAAEISKHAPSDKVAKPIEKIPDITNSEAQKLLNRLGKLDIKINQEDAELIELGPYQFENGDIYVGQWKNGKRFGRGTQYCKDGRVYEGLWAGYKRNGTGRSINANGDVYEGELKDDKAHGKGVYIWKKGDRYDGEWLENKKNGIGTITWSDGDKYSGHWKNDKMDGQGTYTSADGEKYDGRYQEDKKYGYGVYEWSDGRKYKGNWENNCEEGDGTYVSADGKERKGIWIEGFLIKWI